MGFTVTYRTTKPMEADLAKALASAASELCRDRTWLSCEPVHFFPVSDGHLFGGSKPNFLPHPEDAAAAAREGLPDGTVRDLLDILCRLSSEHGVDWEIGHDASDGPVGFIRGGICDEEVAGQIDAFAELGGMLGEWLEEGTFPPGIADQPGPFPGEEDEDGPPILPFRPKGP